MDWASVVPGAITGIVGIAGIGGSILSAKLAGKSATQNLQTSITAENERTHVADKRRIYASFQASLNKLLVAIDTVQTYGAGLEREQRLSDMRAAVTTMFGAISELQLIAPEGLRYLTTDVANLTYKHFRAAEQGTSTASMLGPEVADQQFIDQRRKLYRAMRADLGMPEIPADSFAQFAGPVPGGGG
jgi:hypothetical protein